VSLGPRSKGLHPDLIAKLEAVFAKMAELGHPMRIMEGVRTSERQQQLYAQGRTMPGPIVTNCDGIRKLSNHQVKPDGYGHAADCAFVNDPRTPKDETWDASQPWQTYGELAEAKGLRWGGRFKTLRDMPHVELVI
jgi:peptidoglycan L-alanyl-D-glutamate endopeptidase CwlK